MRIGPIYGSTTLYHVCVCEQILLLGDTSKDSSLAASNHIITY